MAAVDGQQPFQADPDFLHRIPERRSCCGRFCEITYTFLSNLYAAIVAIFLRIFGSENLAQPPAPPELLAADQAALQQQQAHHRAELEAQMRLQRSQRKPATAAAAEDAPPSAKGSTIEDYLNGALAILSNPSASLDDLNTANAMLAIALQLQKGDEKTWEAELRVVRLALLQTLHTLAQKEGRTDIDAFIESSSVATDPLDFSQTAESCLDNARVVVQTPNASIDALLAANSMLANASALQQNRGKILVVKVQEARGTIFYRRYLLAPQEQVADLDTAIEAFRLVIASLGFSSFDLGPPLRMLAKLLFMRFQSKNQKNDLDESIATYNDAIPKLPVNIQPHVHCELGDAYLERRRDFYELQKAYQEYVAARSAKNQEDDFYVRVDGKLDILTLIQTGTDSIVARNKKAQNYLGNGKNILKNHNKNAGLIKFATIYLRVALEFVTSEPGLRGQIEQALQEAEKLLASLEGAALGDDEDKEDALSLLEQQQAAMHSIVDLSQKPPGINIQEN